jgi:hypothetical protein
MKTPNVTKNYFKEREGVLKVQIELNRLGHIFRETPNGDVGIDAQIEHVNENGETTGKIVAAQIKSGNSYLEDKGEYYLFYPKEKHRNYWSSFPLPVILFVYYPNDDKVYFTDVRYQLNVPNKENKSIILPKTSYLGEDSNNKIFETVGDFGIPFYTIEQLFDVMACTICPNPTFNISYLDLFTQGLTNLCRHLYFNIDLVMTLADYNNNTDRGMGMGPNEHEFLHGYATFIMSQNLANIDYSDYLIDWKERELQPSFIAPVTNRARQLFEFIREFELKHQTKLPKTTLIRERGIEMKFYSSDDLLRLEMGKKIRNIIISKNY